MSVVTSAATPVLEEVVAVEVPKEAGSPPNGAAPVGTDSRRHDLDALRAFAMLLGIALHASLSFFPIPWMVQDSQQQQSPQLFANLFSSIHGFRMPLFFILSGYFTMLVYRRRGWRTMAWQRVVRILIPCVIGTYTLVPMMDVAGGIAMMMNTAGRPQGFEPLYQAIVDGDEARVVEELREPDMAQKPDPLWRMRPVSWACLMGRPAIIATLLDHGATVQDANEFDGGLPLHSAVFLGHDEVVKLLLERGADPNATNREGRVALTGIEVPIEMTTGIMQFLRIPAPPAEEIASGRKRVEAILKPLTSEAAKPAPLRPMGGPGAQNNRPRPWPENYLVSYQQFMNSDRLSVNVWGKAIQLVSTRWFDHLWFLWFLCWMVLGFSLCVPLMGGGGDSASVDAGTADSGAAASGGGWGRWWLLPLTIVPQFFMGIDLMILGPDTSMGLLPMPHVLAYYAVFFAFGVLSYGKEVEGPFRRWWWLGLAVGAAIFMLYQPLREGRWVATVVQPIYTWCVCLGMIGAFHALLSRPSWGIRYLSDASYWMYLIHMPLVIVLQAVIRPWSMSPFVKFPLLVLVTSLILLVTYQMFVRWTYIGWLLNGKMYPLFRPAAEPKALRAEA